MVLAGLEREGFSEEGNIVGVDHGNGVVSLFLHLRAVHVSEGQQLAAGDKVRERNTARRRAKGVEARARVRASARVCSRALAECKAKTARR